MRKEEGKLGQLGNRSQKKEEQNRKDAEKEKGGRVNARLA